MPSAPTEALPLHIDIDGVHAVLPRLSVTLEDGRRGWFQRTATDCLRAALATVTQTPYDDTGAVRTVRDLYAWCDAHGFRYAFHPGETWEEVPPAAGAPWIGFSAPLTAGDPDSRHTLVGCDDRVLFDPASGWRFPGGARANVPPIEYVIAIEPRET